MLSTAHAMDPRFELDPTMLEMNGKNRGAATTPPSVAPDAPAPAASASGGAVSHYRIKPGDHLYRVLMREYGLTEERAQALIPEIKRLNGISDHQKLKTGSTILIPLKVAAKPHKRGTKAAKSSRPVQHLADKHPSVPVREEDDPNIIGNVRRIWPRLVAAKGDPGRSVVVSSQDYALRLDSNRYPALPAADGGKVIIDMAGALPPLVQSLIQEKEGTTRIVNGNRNRRHFFSDLLSAAHFYSLEENVTFSFDQDPRLSITADFKIEPTAESVMHDGAILLNIGNRSQTLPSSLVSFLGKNGFQVVNAAPVARYRGQESEGTIFQIGAREPQGFADGLMRSLAIPFTRNRMVDVFDYEESGIKLAVRADRYFEYNGRRFVVSAVTADAVNYTLIRLLETKGYNVIMLEGGDDFRKVTENFISQLGLSGFYAQHQIWPSQDSLYSIQMSGMMLRGKGTGKAVLITDRQMSPLIRELITLNGYRIVTF